MEATTSHTFHIPVLGLAYTVDSPLKVGKFGINSVVSIIEDEMIEKVRAYYCNEVGEEYVPITTKDEDFRARRITAYLNLADRILQQQLADLRVLPFGTGSDIDKYFELLPTDAPLRSRYFQMLALSEPDQRRALQDQLRLEIVPGAIDVNIMSKVDNLTYAADGSPLPAEFSDAASAFRGFAKSTLLSSVVLSAGYNPRLYAYIEQFPDFYPDVSGRLHKKIILKVSDFRSAMVQGKILAKKGVWVSEFRIESGLNCGGHAFATDGILLGPILEEFKTRYAELTAELLGICKAAHAAKNIPTFASAPHLKVTVQGGIGTFNEDRFIMEYYGVDGTGWGSPFLLVPEVTNVDAETLFELAHAEVDDYFISNASPLGIPFHNFRRSTSEAQRKDRILKGRPGSPCFKKFLSSDTEFTDHPICTSSRQYQVLKLAQLQEAGMTEEAAAAEVAKVTAKDCLCEGLTAPILLKNGLPLAHGLKAVTICPGPNLAYFSGVFSLKQMVDHIYGRANILNGRYRKNMFLNELQLYKDYLLRALAENMNNMGAKQEKYYMGFKANLLEGIGYYLGLLPQIVRESEQYRRQMANELQEFRDAIMSIAITAPTGQVGIATT